MAWHQLRETAKIWLIRGLWAAIRQAAGRLREVQSSMNWVKYLVWFGPSSIEQLGSATKTVFSSFGSILDQMSDVALHSVTTWATLSTVDRQSLHCEDFPLSIFSLSAVRKSPLSSLIWARNCASGELFRRGTWGQPSWAGKALSCRWLYLDYSKYHGTLK